MEGKEKREREGEGRDTVSRVEKKLPREWKKRRREENLQRV